jgi:UDP-galactopyranose mutase
VATDQARRRGSACDVVCLSHLRWDFVWQRPQHLMSRCARERRVFFVEEPVRGAERAEMVVTPRDDNLLVCVPHLPDEADATTGSQRLLEQLVRDHGLDDYILWFYTPMALPLAEQLEPRAVVYDCMDELSGFLGAPAELAEREGELLDRADLVFAGGRSLYEAKRDRHPRVRLFASSVDTAHFAAARDVQHDPSDQARIAHPRLGFYGVIDERMDMHLLGEVARLRPDWHLELDALDPWPVTDPSSRRRYPACGGLLDWIRGAKKDTAADPVISLKRLQNRLQMQRAGGVLLAERPRFRGLS